MSDQLLMTVLFMGLLYGLIFTKWAAEWVFVCIMLATYFAGLVTTDEVLDKASNSGVITLVILLLVSTGIEKVSWLTQVSDKLIVPSYGGTLLRMGFVTAIFSAFVNNTAVVAALAHTVRNNRLHPASKLLIPLSYATILGGTMTLIGTSTNLVVNSFLEDATGTGFGFWEFFPIGATATVLGLATLLLSSKLLPQGSAPTMDIDEYVIEAKVSEASGLIGKSILENKLRDLEDLFLVEIVRGTHLISPVSPQEPIEAGDKLIFSGDIRQVKVLESFDGLRLFAVEEGLLSANMKEVIVLPNAAIEGKTVKESAFRSVFDAAVVGMRRGGKRLSGKLGNITIAAGDSMILAVGPDFTERKNLDKNFVIINDSIGKVQLTRLQNYFVTCALLLVVGLASLELVPLIKGAAFLLVGMLVLGVVTGSELRRRFPFELWLIIASALTISQALGNSGLVTILTDTLQNNLTAVGPLGAMIGVFFLTLILTEGMTNNAAAALCFPLAFGLSQSYGVSHMPFVMAVAFGASASFMTPFGYTTNLMVQNMGGYEFRDYFRTGLPISLVFSAVVIFMIPRFFPF
jgi:di/tricarboxylate transporter